MTDWSDYYRRAWAKRSEVFHELIADGWRGRKPPAVSVLQHAFEPHLGAGEYAARLGFDFLALFIGPSDRSTVFGDDGAEEACGVLHLCQGGVVASLGGTTGWPS